MDKKIVSVLLALMLIAGFVNAQAGTISAGASKAVAAICGVLNNIIWMLYMIAAAIGIVVIVLQGIKWAGSAEDPGARKQAKQGIIHAVIGLIIVLLAVWVVALVFTADQCSTSSLVTTP